MNSKMKKFSAIAIAASLFITLSLNAQVNDGFHLGVGPSFSLSGIGVDVAFQPYVSFVQVRTGFTFFPYTYTSKEFEVKEKELNDNYRVNGNVALKVHPNFDAFRFLVDLYPGKNSGFHFTVGAYFNVKPQDGLINLTTANPIPLERKNGANWVPAADDYGNTGYQVNDAEGNERYVITSDKEGYLKANISMGGLRNDFSLPFFRPYLGIGFGRNLAMNKRVAFSFDLGVLYCGKYSINVWGFSPAKSELPSEAHFYSVTLDDVNSILEGADVGEAKDIVNKVYPVLEKIPVAPVMKFNLIVRIF